LFTLGFASSTRTNHGFVSVLSGFPSILDTSVIRARNGRKIPTIASALPDYESTFLYSGDIGFDHMNVFATQGDFKHLIGEKELLAQNPDWAATRSQWGYPDKLFLDYLNRYLANSYALGLPFFSFALTTSNHEPFQLPEDFYKQNPDLKRGSVEAAAAYADSALGEFFEKAKKEPYYHDTIFVFVADHSRFQSPEDSLLKGFHIPIIIHSSRLKNQIQEIKRVAKQVDIPATVLGLLGRSRPEFSRFGHDLLAGDDPETFFAACREGSNYIFAENNYAVRLNLLTGTTQLLKFDQYAHASAVEHFEPTDNRDEGLFLEKSKAYLQTASDVLFGVTQ
jgi:phosphoglycerol transferase MdoB-like AlkP superfamily enzyme